MPKKITKTPAPDPFQLELFGPALRQQSSRGRRNRVKRETKHRRCGPAKTPQPTRDELAEYFAINKKIEAFARRIADLKALQEATEKKTLAHVRVKAGAERCCLVHGYRLSIELVSKKVEWKKALLKELAKTIGADKAQARAEKIRTAAGTREKAKIEPPTDS